TGSISMGRSRVAAGEKPGDRVGRYKLVRQIGEGGCGIVFVAEQEEPVCRRVALKVIKPGMDTKSVIARFEAERQALALMEHPNIAHVFDAGTTESGRPYFVMELVEGMKISDYCDHHSLPLGERLELFVHVCDAIQHAHQKGIIHRDIKPSNVLVTTAADGKPVPKVIDFGIAKATAGQQLTDKTIFTACEMLIGTPAYMSPEQAALTSADVDTRTDIYSLGVLLYELLTGTTPFDTRELLKAGFDEVRRVIRDEEPALPSTRLTAMTTADRVNLSKHHRVEVPKLIREMRGELDWIVMKALEKDRTRRYATANGLAMDIERYLSGEAVLARPPSASYRFRKLVARNKLAFLGIALTFVLLVISLITTTRWLMIERQTREHMRQQVETAHLEGLAWELSYQNKKADAEATFRKALVLRRQSHRLESTPALHFRLIVAILKDLQRFDEIRPLLQEFVAPALLSRLDYREMYAYTVNTFAKRGRWNDAEILADELRKADPTDSDLYHLQVPLLVAKNDVERYRRLCGEIISRFGNATNPSVADQMAKDCLILPGSGADLKVVAALANVAVTHGSNSSSLPYFRLCKALAEFRLSHYGEAIKWAQLASESRLRYPKADALAVIAMSQFNLKQADEARVTLAACNKMFEEKIPKAGEEPGDEWRDWIVAQALLSEAKRMIEGESSSAAPPAVLPR
ncbi:MAG TPA: serine/threonine-protein kinase, partial [Terriglobales bacterium]|nr:serine/threonine-protein kinase [Terriglobales bacterium]